MSVSSLLQKAKRTRFAARCLCADEKNGAHGIAITPAYPEAVTDENLAESGLDAIELNREKGA